MKHILLASLLFISINSYAEIKKWVDEEGKVHYSDTSPNNINAKTIRNTARHDNADTLTPASGVAIPKTLAERDAEWKKSQKTKEEDAQKVAKEKEAALTKQKNCEISRNNLATLENSPEISSYNSKGERTLMDDNARKQSIKEARKAITTFCN